VGLVSAEEFKRRRDIIEKGIANNTNTQEQSNLRKRKPQEVASTQSLLKSKNIGQLSFADDEGEEATTIPKKKRQPAPVIEKKEPILEVEVPQAKLNMQEDDDETKRLKNEAIEVV
jgi:hypothetical protein